MNTLYYKEFIRIAECGSYEQAADELYTTQSTLSKHIQKLEAKLGVMLFERTPRRVKLSKCGEIFLPYARKMQEIESEYTRILTSYATENSQSLVIGTVTNLAAYGISDILVQFQKHRPECRLNISGGSPYAVYRQLMDKKFTVAFLRYDERTDISPFHVIPFTTDRLVCACSKKHPFAVRSSVSITELEKEPFLMFSNGTFLYDFIMASFGKYGLKPSITLSAHRSENLLELASQNLGICCLMEKMALAIQNPNVILVPIAENFECNISLCYLKGERLTKNAETFIQYIKSSSKCKEESQ